MVLEGLRGSATFGTSPGWPVAQALVAACALAAAFRLRERLRLLPLVAVGLAFHLAWVATHLALGVQGDHDPLELYRNQGQVLLEGSYPRSEYPPGAVALFAFETAIGGGHARVPNAFLMIPFQLLSVAAIWALRTRWSAWLAACVAVWPLNAFYWEFRFDLVPAAALAAGVLLARRNRWWQAGFVLGLGTLVKWTPGLAVLALLVWLLSVRRVRTAVFHLLGFTIPLLAVNLALLVWKPSEALAAYTIQSGRTITAESFVYLPLRLVGAAESGRFYFGPADVSPAANAIASWFQLACVVGVLAMVTRARSRSAALAIAALMPAVFLLTNRIFSPQFFVVVVVALAAAAALTARSSRQVLAIAGAAAAATIANTILFQSYLGNEPAASMPGWPLLSAAAFLPALTATACVVVGGVAQRELSVARACAAAAARLGGSVRSAQLAAVLAIAMVYGLLRGVLAIRFPPFFDEGTQAGWTARIHTGAADAFVALSSGAEPLLTRIAAVIMNLGVGALTAGKLVSLVAGAVTLLVVGLIAAELGGRAAALAAAALYAVVPFAVVYEQLGVADALLAATTSTALLLQLRLARSQRLRLAPLLGIVLVAGLLTKRTGGLAIALLPLSLAAFPWHEPDARRRLARWGVGAALALAIALAGAASMRTSDRYEGLTGPLAWSGEDVQLLATSLVGYVTPALLVLALLGLILGARSDRGAKGVVAGWVAAPLVAAVMLAEEPFPRHLLPAVAPIAVLAGLGIGALWERRRPAAALAAAVAIGWSMIVDVRILREPGSARYPGLDDWQFVRGWPAGNAWEALASELPRLRPDGATVAYYRNFPGTIALRMQDRRFRFVRGEDAPWAPLVVENGSPPPDTRIGDLRPVWSFQRPSGGTSLVVHERGVRARGTFATMPDALRKALGLTDSEFDAWLAERPRAFAWYHAWYEHLDET